MKPTYTCWRVSTIIALCGFIGGIIVGVFSTGTKYQSILDQIDKVHIIALTEARANDEIHPIVVKNTEIIRSVQSNITELKEGQKEIKSDIKVLIARK